MTWHDCILDVPLEDSRQMEYVVAAFILFLLVVLVGVLRGTPAAGRSGSLNDRDGFLQADDAMPAGGKPCPLCGMRLLKGETVKSRLITIESSSQFKSPVQESTSYMYGCKYCWPSNQTYTRFCPACKAKLGTEDYVIGRFFEKRKSGDANLVKTKDHLHVLGCTLCRKR